MNTMRTCEQCRQPLPENAPEGLCPACLAKVALGTESAAPSATINVSPLAEAAPGTRVPPKPTDLASQFPQLEILELLGMGGMGMVYKARQPRVDRLVALKILPIASMPDASFAERFEREAKALAKLNHPGIVTLYDFGQTKEYYYFIMELVDGMNLRQLIRAKTLEPRQALKLVTQICTALQFAHDEKIVHRDIKPENILITKKGQVKIADFGLAKLLGGQPDTSLTASQQVMGTVNYMAPEQRENTKDVDHRADIYSLGVVFYEMLTGEVPMGRFEPPSKKVHVDVRLDEVVLHALEREPARRYQRVSEVKTNVETITASMPREKRAAGTGEAFKPQPPPGFVSYVLKRFAMITLAWLAIGQCLRWAIGDSGLTTDPHSSFPVQVVTSVFIVSLGLFAALGWAKIILPVVFVLTVATWIETRAKGGLTARQLPPQIRRRLSLWINALQGGYATLALTTMLFGLFEGTHAPVLFHPEEEAEWWFVPSSGGYEKLGLRPTFKAVEHIAADVYYAPQTCTAVSLLIHRQAKEPSVMNVTLDGLRAQYKMPATNPWTATFVLDRETLVSWLHNGAGLDSDGPRFQSEVDEIYRLLKHYQKEPPQTAKEFANSAKADLRNFSSGGFQGSSGYFNSAVNFSFYADLIVGETLVFLTYMLWATQRIFRSAWIEIEAGRWTPPQLAPPFPIAIKALFGLLGLSLVCALLAGVQGQGAQHYAWLMVYVSLATILVIALERYSGQRIQQAREKGLWPPVGEAPTLEHVKRLAQAGDQTLAFKLYRQIYPVSLLEAKAVVEKLAGQPRPAARNGFELFRKEWSVTHAGHSIRVRNSWNRGLRLFVDEVCHASTNRIIIVSKSRPLLRYEMASEPSPCVIEVYCHALLEVKVKILVNGQWIGGDDF